MHPNSQSLLVQADVLVRMPPTRHRSTLYVTAAMVNRQAFLGAQIRSRAAEDLEDRPIGQMMPVVVERVERTPQLSLVEVAVALEAQHLLVELADNHQQRAVPTRLQAAQVSPTASPEQPRRTAVVAVADRGAQLQAAAELVAVVLAAAPQAQTELPTPVAVAVAVASAAVQVVLADQEL